VDGLNILSNGLGAVSPDITTLKDALIIVRNGFGALKDFVRRRLCDRRNQVGVCWDLVFTRRWR
jgi:hypothetical protein